MLPPRFDRLYQPIKFAQFDRFFARSWAAPLRRSHSTQQSSESDDYLPEFRRNIYRRQNDGEISSKSNDKIEKVEKSCEGSSTLGEFVTSHGFESIKRPTLKRFLHEHDIHEDGIVSSIVGPSVGSTPSYRYVGDNKKRNERVRDEYTGCVRLSEYLDSNLFNPVAFKEFKKCLNGMSLSTNDVVGIKQLAESGYVGRQVMSGPYKGLERDLSAIEVSTVVFEQLNAYEKLRNRGELLAGTDIPVMDCELKRRGFFTEGVKNTIDDKWDRHLSAEKQYNETCLGSSTQLRRSDLTTTNSLKLYTSFFAPDQPMSTTDLTLLGEDNIGGETIKPEKTLSGGNSDFVTRASKKGISILSHKQVARTRFQPLFHYGRQVVPPGFEMINEDMFSRMDNKFMVFNGPAITNWTGTRPATKTVGIENMFSFIYSKTFS